MNMDLNTAVVLDLSNSRWKLNEVQPKKSVYCTKNSLLRFLKTFIFVMLYEQIKLLSTDVIRSNVEARLMYALYSVESPGELGSIAGSHVARWWLRSRSIILDGNNAVLDGLVWPGIARVTSVSRISYIFCSSKVVQFRLTVPTNGHCFFYLVRQCVYGVAAFNVTAYH